MASKIPDLTFTSTPISGVDGDTQAFTGAFFSGQPPSPQDLVSASVKTGNTSDLLMIVGSALLIFILLKKVK